MGNTGTTDALLIEVERPQRRIFDVTKMEDNGGMTPIHYAASQNNIDAVEMLCHHVMRFGDGNRNSRDNVNANEVKAKYLARWINSPTRCDDRFTPMHFAAFFGNLRLIELLIEHGGDPKV